MTNVHLDEKDYQIIELLAENGKYSAREISKKSGIPVTTVLNRVKRLEDEGIIKHYAAKLDFQKLGFNIMCYVMAEISYPHIQDKNMTHEDIGKLIARYPFVSCVGSLAGNKDIMLRVRARDVAELNKFITQIGKIHGVMKTETNLILEEMQRKPGQTKDLIRMVRDKDFADKILKMGQ